MSLSFLSPSINSAGISRFHYVGSLGKVHVLVGDNKSIMMRKLPSLFLLHKCTILGILLFIPLSGGKELNTGDLAIPLAFGKEKT